MNKKFLFLAVILSINTTVLANGNDIAAQTPAQDASGIYLRADTGWAWTSSVDPVTVSGTPVLHFSSANSAILGLGIGYTDPDFPYLRTDVTVAYHPNFNITDHTIDDPVPLHNDNVGHMTLKSLDSFFNVYLQHPFVISQKIHLTPYLGGGVGYSYNMWGDSNVFSENVNYYGQTVGWKEGGNKGSFAWNATVGLLVDITKDLKLDFGYRYVDYGKFETDGGFVAVNNPPVWNVPINISNSFNKTEIRANELQVGLQYNF